MNLSIVFEICPLKVCHRWKNCVMLMVVPCNWVRAKFLEHFKLSTPCLQKLGKKCPKLAKSKSFKTFCKKCHQCKNYLMVTILNFIFLFNWEHLLWKLKVMRTTYAEAREMNKNVSKNEQKLTVIEHTNTMHPWIPTKYCWIKFFF